jgi:hypothetical protein
MSNEKTDRQLGMNRRITRRDFLNGVAVGMGALGCASLPNLASSLPYSTEGGTDSAKTYPPVLTEMAVSASVSYDVARLDKSRLQTRTQPPVLTQMRAIDQAYRGVQEQLGVCR